MLEAKTQMVSHPRARMVEDKTLTVLHPSAGIVEVQRPRSVNKKPYEKILLVLRLSGVERMEISSAVIKKTHRGVHLRPRLRTDKKILGTLPRLPTRGD